MASKIGIAFHHGGIIPALIMKVDKDVTVAPHEAIDVPIEYGQHLIDDKFAYAKSVEKPARQPRKSAPVDDPSPDVSVTDPDATEPSADADDAASQSGS